MDKLTMVASAARTASGTSATQVFQDHVTALRAQLNVTAASGTGPTLDVVLEDTLDGTNWNTLATFTQATGATRQVVNYTGPFSDTIRVRWTVGGVTPSFTFGVVVYSEP